MANPTTNLGMTKPTVGGSTDTWGTTLNANVVDVIDLIFSTTGTDVKMSDISFNSIKLEETGTGTDFVGVKAPTAVSTSYTLTMPAAVPSANQVLSASDGSGTMAWTTPEVGDITSVVAGAGMTGGGTSGAVTLNVIGTADKVTVSADAVTIASTYVGQTSITTLGTVATGVWNGTAIANANLANSSVSYGGVSVALGASDATPAFNLSDATAYTGDSSLVTVGTVGTGTWSATTIAVNKGGTGLTSYAAGDILYASGATTIAKLAKGSDTEVLTLASGVPTWAAPTVGDMTAIVAGAGMTGTSLSGPIPTLNVIGTADKITVSADAVTIASSYVGQTSITTLGTIATGVWNGTAITGDYIDVTTSPLANTKIWIGDSSGDAQEFALSGDVTMTAGGAITVADNAITLAKLEDGTSGDILYYAASGVPTRLAKGSDTEVLTLSSGLPVWSAPTVGDITGVTAGTGLSGGGTSGTVTLNVDASQTQITSVGALNAGSITSGFGAIDVGSSALAAGSGTFSSNVSVTVADNSAALQLKCTDADASAGPLILLDRDTASPADGDAIGRIYSQGRNDADQLVTYSQVTTKSIDVTDGTEDGQMLFDIIVNGAVTTVLNLYGPEIEMNTTLVDMNANLDVSGTSTLTGNVAVGADIVLGATDKLRLDGSASGNTYITEASADNVQIFTGGASRFGVFDSGIFIPATAKIYLDNGGNTYIYESAGDTIDLVAGGTTSQSVTATGTSFNDLAITNVGNIALDSVSSDGATAPWFTGTGSGGATELADNVTNAGLFVKSTYGSSAGLAIGTTSGSGTYLQGGFSDGSGTKELYLQPYGNQVIVTGALSKGSGSFRIPHPLPDKKNTHDLVHSFVEGPRADLIYRGSVALSGGSASVDLDAEVGMTDGTWELLCRDPQVFLQNESGWSALKGSVSGSTLIINCKDTTSSDTISWMVVAERQDEHMKDAGTDWTDEDGRPILEPLKRTG